MAVIGMQNAEVGMRKRKFRNPKSALHNLYVSSWLGWQVEANWADPLLFFTYAVVRPIAASLILLFMYLVVTRGSTSGDLFAYIFVGNAFYMYVGQVLFGISWAVIDDREHYEMIRYIYLSPFSYYVYLIGRGMAKLIVTSIAVVISLLFGIIILKIPINLGTINLPFLFVAFITGLIGIASLGIILAGITLLVPRHSFLMSEGLAGVFYLLCGAIFPIEVLPFWMQSIGRVLPFTYWLEAMRRATLGKSISTSLASYSDGAILLILLISTAALMFLSDRIFKWAEYRARRSGVIDRTTGY
jgi:ABC-2 type transport system permease protein